MHVTLLPVFAQSVVVDPTAGSSNQAALETAPNGVPIQNIATPNASGLSHNKFLQFNVGTEGLVINNSTSHGNSTLAGYIVGNPNLQGGAEARLILNEMTGSTRSSLEGYTEIFGYAAEYILANPYGITCNGCGFINTPRATLTTGVPALEETTGRLMGFSVDEGDVTIGESGVNSLPSDYFDIVSRSIQINGAIHGQNVGVFSGRNDFDYAARTVTAKADDGSSKPMFGIDASLLGGMYANRITLMGTEAGVGVRAPAQMSAGTAGMVLTADGNLMLRHATAEGRIEANSQSDSITIDGTVRSDTSLGLTAQDEIRLENTAVAAAGGDVETASERLILGRDAILAAGLDKEGTLLTSGTLKVTATDSIQSGDALLAGGQHIELISRQIDISRLEKDSEKGIRSLGSATLTAEELKATDGLVWVKEHLDLASGSSLSIDGGEIQAEGDISASADSVTNTADIVAGGHATVEAISGAVSNSGTLSGGGKTTVTASAALTNSGEITAQEEVVVTAGTTLTNEEEALISSGQTLNLAADDIVNKGTLAAQTGLETTATGEMDNSGTVHSEKEVTFNIDGTFYNRTTAAVLTKENLTLSANAIENAGDLIAGGHATVEAISGAVSNSGTLSGGGETAVTASAAITNSGEITAQEEMVVTAGTTLTNEEEALISSGQTLNLAAEDIVNKGTLAAQTDLKMAVTGDIDNSSLMYAGRDAEFKVDGTLNNKEGSDILAERNLTIAGKTNERAQAVINSSANIEALTGDMVIKADTVTNEGRDLVITENETVSSDTTGQLDNSSSSQEITTTVTTTEETISTASAPAKLLAGGHLTIETETLTNSYSQIAANGDVTLTAGSVVNEGRDLIETTETVVVTKTRTEYCAQRIIWCVNHKHRTVTTTSAPVIVSETVDAVYGTIEAGGQLNAQVTGYVLNNAIRHGADQIGLSSGNRAPASPAASTPSGPASPAASTPSGPASPAASTPSGPAASATSTPSGPASPAASTPPRVTSPQILIMNDIENLVTRRGLFAINPDPTSPFLIETRPGFTDPGRFFGSDYFLSRVGGYAPEVLSKRLGDAFVETQLIREQLFQQTGRRLLKGFGSDLAQIKGLYDNALAVARAFQLTPGIQLTAAQVANLTHDIIWMEEMEVRGQRVLVPRVYLARVTRAHTDLASGRLIGNTVGIQTGLLHNTGAIEGRTRVALDTSLAIVNEGGLIASDGEVAIASAGTVANLSGLITGEHVTVQGQTILNDTQVMRDTRGTLGSQDFAYADRRQQRARISAGQTLTVTADDDIRSTGGTFQAGAALDLTAGGTVQLQARALETRLHLDEPEVTVNKFALRHEESRAKAGGAVTLRAGQDVVLVGADVVGGGDVTVDAGGAVIVQSVQDRDESAFKLSIKSGGLFGTKVNIEEHRTHTEVERSALKAGGDLTVTARGGDVTLKAAELASGGQTELRADTGQVALLTETEIDYEQKKESDDSLLWFSTSDKGHHDETTVHVQIQASGGLTITTQDGVVVEYREAGSLDESLAQLAGTPGLDWLDELRGRDDVNWQAIQEAHEAWDHKAQGLSGVASALIAIAIALVTYGAGFEFALGQMGAVAEASAVTASTTLATTTQLAVAVAIDAGFTALVTQASLSLINNQGDLAAVFQHLGSLDTLTSLATSMAAAGLTYGALDQLGLAGTQTGLLAKMERTLVRATTRAGVQTALQGGNLGDNLVANLQTAGIAAVGAEAAEFIGQAYDHGNIDYATRLVAQAAVGCGMGAASGNCASGAGGAVIGEVAGDLYLQMQDAIRDPKNHKLDIVQLKQDGVNMARLVGGLTALVAGGDVTTAVQTAGNAAEQNAFRLVTLTLKAANKLGQIYRTTGKLTVQNLKDTGMVELVGMVDDLHTLFSSETSDVDKAGALFGLVIGIDFKDIKTAYSFATKVVHKGGDALHAARKGANRTHVTQRTAAAVNAESMAKGHRPPYKQGTRVTEYTTKGDEQFVRVHGTDNAARPWMMSKEAVDGLTPEQIQRKYSLPYKPKFISDVHVPAGTRIRTGKIEGNFGGQGGATQYEWLTKKVPPSAISNTRPLN